MALRSYPDYKLSGMKWLEHIPVHWSVERGKRLLKKMERPVRDTDDIVTCFRDGVVTLRKNRRTEGFTESLQEIGYQGIRAGDLVIHAMDAFAGAVGVSDSDGKGTPVYSVCKPEPGANAYYYASAIREMARSQWIAALAKGIRERSTDFRYVALAAEPLPVPPLDEQTAIVRYLDHADRRVRRYISAKERMIELLTEQKQAIINQAVTRGLDPNVPLKPSGVEWLGDVPAHWEVRRLSASTVDCVNGIWGSDANGVDDIRCVRVADFDRRSLRVRKPVPTLRAIERNKRTGRILRSGDLLLEKSGGGKQQPVGVVILFDHPEDAVCSNFVARVRVRDGFDPLFLTFLHSALYSKKLNTRSIKQTTGIQNLDSDAYLNESVAFPPPSEQVVIAEFLEKARTDIDAGIDKVRCQIELMQEYRTRLIADVVTGKLDVRGAVADKARGANAVAVGSQPIELDLGR